MSCRSQSLPAVLLVLSAFTLVLGCGADPMAGLGDPIKVMGLITMDGKPAANVEVQFARLGTGAPGDVRNVAASTDAEGKYAMEAVYPAEYKVMISEPAGQEDPAMVSAMDVGPYAKYGMESTLTATVAEGKTEHNFELTKSAKK